MRITTNMIYDRNLASMSKVSERQNTAYNQLMTGDKFGSSRLSGEGRLDFQKKVF